VVDDFRLQRFDSTLEHLLDIQGGCERIKKTPMPRGYGFIAERLIAQRIGVAHGAWRRLARDLDVAPIAVGQPANKRLR